MTKQVVALAGVTNIGKTGWLLLMAERNPELPFYILDTQNRVAAVAAGVTIDGKVPSNVEYFAIDEANEEQHPIEQGKAWMKEVVIPAAKEGTIVYCVDMVGKVWDWARDFYVWKQTGKHQADLDSKAGKSGVKTDFNVGIDDQHSWSRIKGWHNDLVYVPINSPLFDKAHVLLTSAVRDMRTDPKNPLRDKDEDVITMWKHFGQVLPESEKHLTYEAYTVLGQDFTVGEALQRKHRITLIKDMKRGRSDSIEFFRKETLDVDSDGMWDVWGTYCRLRGVESTDLGVIE